MINHNFVKIIIFTFSVFLIIFFYSIFFKKNLITKEKSSEDTSYTTNTINNVNYTSTDAEGNEYIVMASRGEFDYSNDSIIFLTDVSAFFKINNSDEVMIVSAFGKYNIDNYDTIFSKNISISYAKNKILGDYLDFSLKRNSLILSKNITFRNNETILKADVLEIDFNNKNVKIFMHNEENKVNIISKD